MNPVRYMLINAVLWLPLGFFLWFLFGSVFVLPVGKIAAALAHLALPEVFNEVVQTGKLLEFDTLLDATAVAGGKQAVFVLSVNPMIYGYGIPLLLALVMSTPLTAAQRVKQLMIGWSLVLLAQGFGVFAELLKDLAFKMGPPGQQALADSIFIPDVIALMYQTGYLILPGVVPIATWVLMNRAFVEQIISPYRDGE